MNIPELHRKENKDWRYRLERKDWSRVPEWNRPKEQEATKEEVDSLECTIAVAELAYA